MRVCSRKRVDPMTRKRHRESRDLQSREEVNRHEITEQIVLARLAMGLTWQALADAIGRPVMWTTAALLGQHPIPAELGKVLVEMLGLDESAIPVLAAPPMRGGLPTTVPTDPTIYR